MGVSPRESGYWHTTLFRGGGCWLPIKVGLPDKWEFHNGNYEALPTLTELDSRLDGNQFTGEAKD